MDEQIEIEPLTEQETAVICLLALVGITTILGVAATGVIGVAAGANKVSNNIADSLSDRLSNYFQAKSLKEESKKGNN